MAFDQEIADSTCARCEKGGNEKENKTMEKPINTGKYGPGNPGRPKGAANKTTLAAKEMIAQAAEKLGGLNRLVSWAQEDQKNESAFWASMYPKLLPLQVSGPGPNGEHVFSRIVREVIDAK